MPSVAAMTVAVVQAMPLVVKTRLYGAFSPVSFSVRSARTVAPELLAGDLFALVGEDVVAVTGRPMHQFVGQFVVVLQRVHQ